jgi:hypothetical protein
MIHVVVMKCLIIPFITLVGEVRFRVRDLEIEESESEVLCTDSTALMRCMEKMAKLPRWMPGSLIWHGMVCSLQWELL